MTTRFCENCGDVVKRIRTTNQNLNFCSSNCQIKFHAKLRRLIKIKEKELSKLKKLKKKCVLEEKHEK